MILEDDFYKKIKKFQNNFNFSYGEFRERLLYESLEYITEGELDHLLKILVTRFNKDNLPTIETIIDIATDIYPESIKQ